jgi:hypothetical protein
MNFALSCDQFGMNLTMAPLSLEHRLPPRLALAVHA